MEKEHISYLTMMVSLQNIKKYCKNNTCNKCQLNLKNNYELCLFNTNRKPKDWPIDETTLQEEL